MLPHIIGNKRNIMNKILIIFITLFIACSSSKRLVNNNEKMKENIELSLSFLHLYKSSVDTNENRITIYYNKLNLKEERKDKSFDIILNDQIVITGDRNNYQYLFEVYKESYLVISYVKGYSYASGFDLFERDNVLILDLQTGDLCKVSLKSFYLTRSKDFLLKNYYHKEISNEDRLNTYCTIENINFKENKLTLYTQDLENKEYEMIKIDKPFQHK
jgi:hypothetical protein